jgi:hypothetical protein
MFKYLLFYRVCTDRCGSLTRDSPRIMSSLFSSAAALLNLEGNGAVVITEVGLPRSSVYKVCDFFHFKWAKHTKIRAHAVCAEKI